MAEIRIERGPSAKRLGELGVEVWPIWEKEVSEFPWHYDEPESCYFLEGDVVVTPKDGKAVRVGKGDYVVFPEGMSCTWKVEKPVKKHYRFG
ncbi:MAG: cupin domain-containing protein [Planctomycetes bacterium]|nr:cupin domain-containing protein [Planctomycetota bacterium]